jgi:hypothetical protein
MMRDWLDDDAVDALYAIVHAHAALITALLLVAHIAAAAVHASRVVRVR